MILILPKIVYNPSFLEMWMNEHFILKENEAATVLTLSDNQVLDISGDGF